MKSLIKIIAPMIAMLSISGFTVADETEMERNLMQNLQQKQNEMKQQEEMQYHHQNQYKHQYKKQNQYQKQETKGASKKGSNGKGNYLKGGGSGKGR